MIRMNPAGKDGWMNSLREWMIRMNRMIPAGLGGKNKRDEWMEPLGGMNRMTGGVDGKGKTPRLNTLEGDPSKIENRNEERGIRNLELGKEGQMTEGGRQRTAVGDQRFRSTWDIIEAAERGLLPDKVMLNVHPQRWTDRPLPWVKEFVGQNFKNVVKKAMLEYWDKR
jgi:hypothetical protein